MLLLILLMLLHENLARPQQLPPSTINEEKLVENQRPLVFAPQFQRQQYFHYDFPLLEPQFYGYPNNKPQILPTRVQPQIVLYHHGNGAIPAAPGQSFLLQPGPLQPPGNFLVPSPPQQSPPFLIAGYPKPAHIPPIEKDAEEIPTNPSKIPPLTTKQGRNKPEKLETLDTDKRVDSEIDGLAEADRSPTITNLHPGQRFFILNGEHLYPSLQNYPYPQKFSEMPAARENPANFLYFNQNPEMFMENRQPQQFLEDENREDDFNNLYRLVNNDNDGNMDAVVIDSADHDDNDNNNSEPDNSQDDIIAVYNSKADEQPTVSQAQPGAVAIAGPGGVAAAAPRGTAFAGKDGVAVSSPQATAVAGPKPKQTNKENNNNNNNNNNNSNKKEKRQ